MRPHRYAVGQHVSYAADYSPNMIWLSGYEIVALLPAGNREPQYQIRTDNQTYDQVVWESQLQAGHGSRKRRLNNHAMRTATALASPDHRSRQHRTGPKQASQHQDLTRWDDEGGAPRAGHHFSEPPPSQSETETALYYFNIRTGSALVDDPEGNRYPDLQAARDVAVAMARNLTVEGEQQDEDRQCWQVEIMDRANKLVMTVAFVDIRDPRASG